MKTPKFTMRKAGVEMATFNTKVHLTRWQVKQLESILKGGGYPANWTLQDLLSSLTSDGIFRLQVNTNDEDGL